MRSWIAIAALCAVSGPLAAEDCEHSAERNAAVALEGAKRVVIAAGAGELRVRGEQQQKTVEARGRACASTQALLEQIQIESRREGDALYVRTALPDLDGSMFSSRRYAYLDLTITGPQDADYEVEDSSGDLVLANVRSAKVADSSGDQSIENIAGDLEVSDSSGDVEIRRIAGRLRLTDSSGDVDVEEVQGDVHVPVDSSGDLQIRRIAGGVHIESDSSGSIVISEVQRDVRIDVDSSGDIRVDRIGGAFTLGKDSSGSVSHSRVMGKVDVPQQE